MDLGLRKPAQPEVGQPERVLDLGLKVQVRGPGAVAQRALQVVDRAIEFADRGQRDPYLLVALDQQLGRRGLGLEHRRCGRCVLERLLREPAEA